MTISIVDPKDRRTMAQVKALLEQEGITLDGNLDCTCCMFDEDYKAVATGSCFGNTLRCFAVSREHQGEGLLGEIISWLIQYQADRGNFRLFLYTKCESAKFFRDLGFYEIARVEDKLVFMENRRNGFSGFLQNLKKETPLEGQAAAIVMNANPFTLGHLYLAEMAAAENEVLHLFVVSEDLSLVPFAVRKRLVREGTSHLSNVVIHNCGPYIISGATFPSYFLKDEASVVEGHARLDLEIFGKIASELGITRRYVGEEPTSLTTNAYNRIMAEELPKSGVSCVVVPRKTAGETAISASTVRQYIQRGDLDRLEELVPTSTAAFFRSPEAADVIAAIRHAENVIHH